MTLRLETSPNSAVQPIVFLQMLFEAEGRTEP